MVFKGRYNRKRVFRRKLPFVVGADGVPIVIPKKTEGVEQEQIDESIQRQVDKILEPHTKKISD